MIRKWSLTSILASMLLGLSLTAPALAADKPAKPHPMTPFTKVNVFDGKSEKRIMDANVLVEGNLIKLTCPPQIGPVWVIITLNKERSRR